MHTASLCDKGRPLIINGHDRIGGAARGLVLMGDIVALLGWRRAQVRITELAIVVVGGGVALAVSVVHRVVMTAGLDVVGVVVT